MFASIFIAVILILIVFYVRKLLKIPKELKNIPYMPQLPFVWAVLRQKYHDEVQDVIRKSLKEGHDIHISRCGKTIFLNITSPEFVKDLLVEPVDVTPKLQFPSGEAVHKVFGNGLLFSNGDIWRAHRKLASSAFNSTLTPEMVGETTMEFFTFMQNNLNRPIDAYGIMQRLTLEIIGKLAFGYKFGYLESEETPHIINVYKFIIDVAKSVILVSFPWISKLPTERNRKFHKLIKEFDSFIFNIIGMRRKEVNIDRDICYKDLLSTMLKLSEIDRVYYDTRSLRDEVVTFFIAGHDTTSMALAASMYHLAKCPEMQEKARAEVISVLGNELVIPNSAQLKKLKYINAIIKETLRMYPPVPATNLRELTKPIKVGPYVIPEKVLCTVNIWQVQRHPKFWDNPNQFDPERFMGNEKRHQFAWIPFAAGPRNCVGQNFALSEQRIILSMMLLKYNWTLPENSINKDKLLLNSSFLLKPIDLQLTFTERI